MDVGCKKMPRRVCQDATVCTKGPRKYTHCCCLRVPSAIPKEMLTLVFVVTCMASCLIPVAAISQEMEYIVARPVPFTDTALSGVTLGPVTCSTRICCLIECMNYNCSSFNYGNGTCELFSTYLCQWIETLVSKKGYRYYDVEVGDFIQVRLLCEYKLYNL